MLRRQEEEEKKEATTSVPAETQRKRVKDYVRVSIEGTSARIVFRNRLSGGSSDDSRVQLASDCAPMTSKAVGVGSKYR